MMMSSDLLLVTKNDPKFEEFKKLFAGTRYTLRKAPIPIEEIQTEDMGALVQDKVIKAYDKIRRPVFVDHTGLQLDVLGGFPAGLTEIFWNRIQNERLARLFGDTAVTAVTLIGYCDGKSVTIFRGEVKGTIASVPRGPEGFQWDPIFIPDGRTKTFVELGDEKNTISMRRLAINEFVAYLDRVDEERH